MLILLYKVKKKGLQIIRFSTFVLENKKTAIIDRKPITLLQITQSKYLNRNCVCVVNPYSLTKYFILDHPGPCLFSFKQSVVLIGNIEEFPHLDCYEWLLSILCVLHCDIRFLCSISVFYITQLGRCNKEDNRSLLELNNFSPYVFLVSVIQLSGKRECGLLSDVI